MTEAFAGWVSGEPELSGKQCWGEIRSQVACLGAGYLIRVYMDLYGQNGERCVAKGWRLIRLWSDLAEVLIRCCGGGCVKMGRLFRKSRRNRPNNPGTINSIRGSDLIILSNYLGFDFRKWHRARLATIERLIWVLLFHSHSLLQSYCFAALFFYEFSLPALILLWSYFYNLIIYGLAHYYLIPSQPSPFITLFFPYSLPR